MEYVEGELLSSRVAAGPLPVGDALDIALQLADALDEAHGRGIVHRDIKSANVMITDRQLVKVLDFGLAKFLKAPRASDVRTLANVTAPGLVLGTLNYMAPEQLSGGHGRSSRRSVFGRRGPLRDADRRSCRFRGRRSAEIADRVLHHEPEAIARFNYAVPEDVETIVRKALQKRPEFRYQTARDFYIDLLTARRRLSGDSARRSAWLSPIDFADAASPLPMLQPAGEARRRDVTVAVLNFANITGNAADDWIGQGIAESLTADLTRITTIAVVAREQIFELQRSLSEVGRNIDERQAIELGRRLGATVDDQRRLPAPRRAHPHHLSGDRRRHRPAADDRESRWPARRSVRAAGSAGQRADRGASSVEVQQQDRAAMEGVGTESIDAYQAYSRGMLNLRLAGRESMERAIALFERALELDPELRRGDGRAGRCAWSSSHCSSRRRTCSRRASRSIDRALTLRPDDADAHVQRGDTLLAMGRAGRGHRGAAEGRAPQSPIVPPPTAASRARIGWARGRSTTPSTSSRRCCASTPRPATRTCSSRCSTRCAATTRRPSASRGRRSACRIR